MNLGVGSEAEVKRRNHLKIFQTLKENQLNQGSGLTPDESLIWFKQKTFFILSVFFVYSCLSEGWTWVGIQIAPSPLPPAPARGYLEPIPFHLAQFSTPVHPGGSSGLTPGLLPLQKGMIQLQKFTRLWQLLWLRIVEGVLYFL